MLGLLAVARCVGAQDPEEAGRRARLPRDGDRHLRDRDRVRTSLHC